MIVKTEPTRFISPSFIVGASPITSMFFAASHLVRILIAALIFLLSPALQADDYSQLHTLTEVELLTQLQAHPNDIFIQLALTRKVGQMRHEEAISLLENFDIDSLTEAQRIYYEGLSCGIRIRKGDMNNAKEHCEIIKVLLQEEVADPIAKAIGNNALGYYYARQGKPEAALEYFEKGLTFVAGKKDPALKVMLLHNRGVALMLSGFRELAIAAFEDADSENKYLGADDPLPNLLAYNLGYLQAQSGQHYEALKSYSIALPWFKASKQYAREYIAHTQVSLSLSATEQYQSALDELLPWVGNKEVEVTPDSEAQAYLALANAYVGLGDRTRAQESLELGIKIARESGNPSRLRELSLAFASMLIKNKEYLAARNQLEELLTILNKRSTLEGKAEAHRLLGTASAGLALYLEAYEHSLMASQEERIIQNDSFKRRLASLKITNQLDLKDQQLALSVEREAAIRASNKLTKYMQVVGLIGLIVAFILSFLLYGRYNNQRKAALQRETEIRLQEEVELRTKEVKEELNKRHSAEQEQVALELRLLKDDKLRSIGQLTGGVAHDFNNLMTVISLSAELLLPSLDKKDKKLVEDIIGATGSGRAITKDLLAYARQQTLRPETINLQDYIESRQSLFVRSLNESIQFRLIPLPENESVFIKVDEGQLTSSMINLLFNARDACLEKGVVELSMSRNAGKVRISICDNGHGMTAEQVEIATEPFYSTKNASEGAGLGLSMVYGFMKQSGGELFIQSTPDSGSIITLQFDEVDGEGVVEDKRNEPADKTDVSNIVILIVEDESRIRDIGKLVLEKIGYSVLLAEDGDQAMEILSEEPGIDLMITDLVMPGSLSGEKLADYTKEHYPKIRILLMSGYVKELPEDYAFLAKPFTLKELGDAVTQELEKN